MLRLLALALLLANGLYFAWGNGLLLAYGFGPTQQSEPQRLAQQISPEAVRLLNPKEFQRIEEQVKADREPKECLLAGPFDAAQSAALRLALADSLPAASWSLEELHIPPRWIVYMGKYASAELLAKKRAEIAAMSLPTERLGNPALEPGISLAGFEARADADAALTRLSARGLHTAHVVQERAESTAYQLKLPAVSAALKSKLGELGEVLADKPLHPCVP
jgi:hypothetical protein